MIGYLVGAGMAAAAAQQCHLFPRELALLAVGVQQEYQGVRLAHYTEVSASVSSRRPLYLRQPSARSVLAFFDAAVGLYSGVDWLWNGLDPLRLRPSLCNSSPLIMPFNRNHRQSRFTEADALFALEGCSSLPLFQCESIFFLESERISLTASWPPIGPPDLHILHLGVNQ